MKNSIKYNYYLYIVLQFLIGIDIIHHSRGDVGKLVIYFGLFLIITINEYLRGKACINTYFISIIASIVIGSLLALKLGGYSYIYMYTLLYELILFTEGKTSKILTGLVMILAFLIPAIGITPVDNLTNMVTIWRDNFLDLFMILMGILFYSISLLGFKTVRKEKKEVERLNKELEVSYGVLEKQSREIEKLTLTNERNRVAGEIHDNLGHSLIALNMNLDVAGKIFDKDAMKAKELIDRSQILTKESMENLRKAVYALKEKTHRTLKDSIEKIINNIESTGKVNLILNINEKAEEILPEYKDIIYLIVKESITNSIRHGKSEEIIIAIILEDEELKISIIDNGFGCINPIKGNGLLGIEGKVNHLGGTVTYNSENKKGFKLDLIFPYGADLYNK